MLGNTRNNFVPNTAVLGWGRSKIDGVAYGARDNTGQSPSDRITKKYKSFTGLVMDEWKGFIKNNSTGIDLARYWIMAVIEINETINNDKTDTPINKNCHNAISIGTDNNGVCNVFMIYTEPVGNGYSFSIITKEIR